MREKMKISKVYYFWLCSYMKPFPKVIKFLLTKYNLDLKFSKSCNKLKSVKVW